MGRLWLAVLVCAACGGDDHQAGPDGGMPPGDGSGPDGPTVMGGDPTFGDHGLATVNLGTGLAGFTAAAHQSSGNIVAVGATQEAIVVVRTTATGDLDTSFGTGGVVELPFGLPANGIGNGQDTIAVQADDKIVVAGVLPGGVYGRTFHTAIVRLTADGALDTGFGTGGIVLSPDNTILSQVAVQPDGKILAGGGSLARFAADGSLDTAFGTNGVAFPPGGASVFALEADGSIACAGQSISHVGADGKVDMAFGTGGQATIPNPTFENRLTSIAVQPDGKILAGGAILVAGSPGSQPPFALVRVTAAGVLDTTFGGGDGIADDGSTMSGLAEGILVTAGGIIATGPSNFGGSPHTCVRLDTAGALDATFSCSAGVTIELGPPHALADGSFFVPGASLSGFAISMALAKNTASGGIDSSYGGGVIVHDEGGSFDRAQALAVAPDGSVLVGGWNGDGLGTLVRLTAAGELDPAFGTAGIVKAPSDLEMEFVTGLAVQPTGKIVAVGLPLENGFTAFRLDDAGALDPGFGSGGSVQVTALGADTAVQSHGFAMGADGSLFVVGEAVDDARTAGQFALLHLTADGAVDTAYGTGGTALTAFTAQQDNAGKFVSVAQDGSAIVLGLDNFVPTLVRFDATGALDTTFGTIQWASDNTGLVDVFGLARQSDGKVIAVAGHSDTGELDIVRVGTDGMLDATWGTAGIATVQLGGGDGYRQLQAPMGVAIDADGKLVVGVAISAEQTLIEQAALVRLGTDGSLDATWGTAGIERLDLGAGSSSLHALLFQPDGKLLAAGRRWTSAGSSDFAVLRLAY